MKQRSYPHQTGLFELGNGHVLRQYEASPHLFVLDHQSQVGVAVVDLRDELAVANLQKGKQRERRTNEFSVVVQGDSVRWAELNVSILQSKPDANPTEISAETRKSTLAVRLEAISQKIGAKLPFGS